MLVCRRPPAKLGMDLAKRLRAIEDVEPSTYLTGEPPLLDLLLILHIPSFANTTLRSENPIVNISIILSQLSSSKTYLSTYLPVTMQPKAAMPVSQIRPAMYVSSPFSLTHSKKKPPTFPADILVFFIEFFNTRKLTSSHTAATEASSS